ncbi:MAG: hypothetical protein UY07_C0015G0002 [Parcubacteria group bacterium GW2011_GWA1_47_8]|nr:MAG: hypothetical protein UY07_C0015G0002 [Parcubacteria group bacterium GW2011_GWA1_47_8]
MLKKTWVLVFVVAIVGVAIAKKQLDRPVMHLSDVTGRCLSGNSPQGKLACEYFKDMNASQYDREKIFDQRF